MDRSQSSKEKAVKKKKEDQHKTSGDKEKIETIERRQYKLKPSLKKLKKDFIPTVSIGYDKRWSTYICIIKIKGGSKSFYLGKEEDIKKRVLYTNASFFRTRHQDTIEEWQFDISYPLVKSFIDTNGRSLYDWPLAKDLSINDYLFDKNLNKIKIHTIEFVSAIVDTYNFEVENSHTYIAENYIVHNVGGDGPGGGKGGGIDDDYANPPTIVTGNNPPG